MFVSFNAAYVTIPPKRTQQAHCSFIDDCICSYSEDVTVRGWEMIEEARREIAKLMNCDFEEVAFTKNTFEGVGIISNGYPFKEGDNIIIVDLEHTSNLLSWVNQSRSGLDLKVIKSREGYVNIEDIEANVDVKTVAVVYTTVQFSTGFRV